MAAQDPDLARLLRRLGEPPIWGRRPGFHALMRIVLEQQVSLAAAKTLYRRVDAHLGGITPHGIEDVTHLRVLPSKEEQQAFAGRWAPWRSVAARILWAHYVADR